MSDEPHYSGQHLTKDERLHGQTTVSRLLNNGSWGNCAPLRFCRLSGNGCGHNRILVSVPKKFFKRAVKRNLLKRRIREAYRTQKSLLPACDMDILFVYSCNEVLSSEVIRNSVAEILKRIAARETDKYGKTDTKD